MDEVESLDADRQKLSLEANPVDVHRASDAVLAQLDHLAIQNPNVLFIATSNFPKAIDEAFLSRADLRVDVGLPGKEACFSILRDTIEKLALGFPGLRHLLDAAELRQAGESCHGLDGRQIRKTIISAMTFDKNTALNPELQTAKNILDAVGIAKLGTESA